MALIQTVVCDTHSQVRDIRGTGSDSQLTIAADGEPAGSVAAHTHRTLWQWTNALCRDSGVSFEMKEKAGEDKGITTRSERSGAAPQSTSESFLCAKA